MSNQKKIAIIGCGNLGLSILKGLMKNKSISNSAITVTKRKTETLSEFQSTGIHVLDNNEEAVRQSDIILFALKPYNVLDVLKEVSNSVTSDKTIVSLATGISTEEIQSIFEEKKTIYRAMPNTAASVNESVTCICSNSDQDELEIEAIFNSLGSVIKIDEKLMDAATVLGACGIAYALRFIRSMVQGGVEIGFDAQTASAIANQTVKGAAELLIKNGNHPEAEIDKVTTPKGCTIAGLNEMEHNGFSSALIKGISTSFEKIEQ